MSSWSRIAVSLSRVSQPSSVSWSTVITTALRPAAHTRPAAAADRVVEASAASTGAGRRTRAGPRPTRRRSEPDRSGDVAPRSSRHARRPAAGVEDADPRRADRHLHALADQPPGDGVGVGVDLDRSSRSGPGAPARGSAGTAVGRSSGLSAGLVAHEPLAAAARPSCRGRAGRRSRASTTPDALRAPPSSRSRGRRSRCASRSRRRARPCPWCAPGTARRPAAETPVAARTHAAAR